MRKLTTTRRGVFGLAMGLATLPALAACVQEPEGIGMATETETRNKALAEAGFKAWRDRTGSPYDLLDENVEWTIVGRSLASRTYSSRDDFITNVIRPFNARMRDPLRPTIRSLFAEGDNVIIFFDASGVAKDGGIYTNTYAWFWEMRDGRVVKAHAFFDSVTFNDFWQRVSPT
jgi:ketosteroid isomerase-like protein